jgi:hypothetical protein
LNMIQLSNAATALLRRCLEQRGAQAFGSCFQHAVVAALNQIEEYKGCYGNPAAGQPDIIAGRTGIEVKSSAEATIRLTGNYAAIRGQYEQFRLVGLRTDHMLLWALIIPGDMPDTIKLGAAVDPPPGSDSGLERSLKDRLTWVLETAGTAWSDAASPDLARQALDRVLDSAAIVG